MFRLNVCPFAGALALSLAAGMASCVDHAYDLDRDIDMTISVGGEYLAIPAGSTDTAYLSKLIDEGDLLTVDGASHCYQLTKKDDVSVQPTSVKTVEIGQIESDGFTPVNIAGAGAALVTFALAGQVDWHLGLIAGLFGIAGHYLGATLVVKNGTAIVRPIILVVLLALFAKTLWQYFA